MQVVSSISRVWLTPGIASTDVASLMNCGFEGGPLVLWSRKVEMIEKQEDKRMQKVTLDQGTPEWLKWREAGYGGSEVSSLVGANKWKSPLALYKEKIGETGGTAENADMKRGKDKEPLARQLYCDLFDCTVEPLCVIHDEYDFIRCSLDGLRVPDEKLIIEIKCPKAPNHIKALTVQCETDPVQQQECYLYHWPYYFAQVQYQMLITDVPLCHFVSFNDGDFTGSDVMAVIPVREDKDYQEYLKGRVIEFHEFVQSRTPPTREWCSAAK